MAYNQDVPVDNTADIRENFRALKEDKIVTAASATTADSATTAESCTGNAATATKLETTRTINGVAFDGTADITITTGIPIGSIVMWSGSIASIPTEWVLCNGLNGTPDLRDKFILGAGSSYSVGANGGESTHKLLIAEMPSHNHNIIREGSYFFNKYSTDFLERATGNNVSSSSYSDGLTKSSGGDQPHNNMPPYYALAYIMRTA